MRKFILIDQSIKDAGGHHLEYALRVLKAAKSAGFETVLAVNKSCKNFELSEVDVLEKSFSNGFWENFACERQVPSKRGKSIAQILIEKKEDFIYEVLFSQLGYAYQLLSEGKTPSGLAKKYHLVSEDQKIPLWAIAAGAVLLRIRQWHRRLTSLLNPVFRNAGKTVRLLVRIIKLSVGIALAPAVLLYLAFRWKNISGRFDRFSILFGNECRHLLARVDAKDGDLVFVPTLGDVELTGIGLCSHAKALSGIEWHLLFRRNLFVGREQNYLNQIESVQKTHLVLSEFKENFEFGTVAFYTDTNPLSEQWNILGIYSFSTLPIPHDDSLKKTTRKAFEPLIVSYIGDARDEKGFQHLARLVGDIRAAGFDSGKVRFRFQSNFNVPLGESGSRIAKAELSLMSSDGVELLEGPFDSNEYINLINTSDILLVPYDENNYYARSSGVFAEALAAGVPVVYPARSWMGRELLDENIRYSKSVEKKFQCTPWNQIIDRNSKLVHLSVSKTLKNPFVFFYYKLTAAQPGEYAKLSFYEVSLNKSLKGKKAESLDFVGAILIDLRVDSGTCFYRFNKPGTYEVHLEHSDGLSQDNTNQNLTSYFTDIRYRLAGAEEPMPVQSVGYGYEAIEDLSVGVREILSHYESYEENSLNFAKIWGEFHSASNLVRMLSSPECGK